MLVTEKVACSFDDPLTLSGLTKTVKHAAESFGSDSLGRVHKCGDMVGIAVNRTRAKSSMIPVHACLIAADSA